MQAPVAVRSSDAEACPKMQASSLEINLFGIPRRADNASTAGVSAVVYPSNIVPGRPHGGFRVAVSYTNKVAWS